MRRKNVRIALVTSCLLAITTLAACSSKDEPPPPMLNEVGNDEDEVAPPETIEENSAPPVATTEPVNVAVDAPEERAAPDQQILDDAAAVGMTARVQRDEGVVADSGSDASGSADTGPEQ